MEDNMKLHIRTSDELKQLSMQILAQARERAQKEEEALRRLLGRRSREWVIEDPERAQDFLRWLNDRTTDASEKRVLTEVLRSLKSAGPV